MNPVLVALAALSAAHAGPVFVGVDVAQRMVGEGAVVLDARGEKAWKAGHVPGSAPVAWTDHRDGWLREGRLTADAPGLAAKLGALGVRDDAPVLILGPGRDGWGEEGRIYWMLDYLGHNDVHIVDGGWPVWTDRGLPTTTDRVPPRPGVFTARPREGVRARVEEVAADLGGPVVFWDTREAREFAGETPYREARGGHLPGARHLWFKDLMQADGTLKPRGELRALLQQRGIPVEGEVVAYCTGGVRSGFAYAVLKELGSGQVANYDGSMWEWTADAARPVE